MILNIILTYYGYGELENKLIGLFRFGAPDFVAAGKLINQGADVNAMGKDPDKNILSEILHGYWWTKSGDNIPVDLIENVRLTRVYKPKVLEIMSDFEFSDCWWGNSQEECNDALAFIKRWNEKNQ